MCMNVLKERQNPVVGDMVPPNEGSQSEAQPLIG